MKIAANKRALLWCALPLCASATQADAQDRVGVTSAVNPSTTGQPPAAAQRILLLGQDVVRNETVRTSADGQAQLLFLDKSSFSIGPNSEVVIDELLTATAPVRMLSQDGDGHSKNAIQLINTAVGFYAKI